MDCKTTSAHSLPRVAATNDPTTSESLTLSKKVNVDKLAEKLKNRPKAEIGARLLLVAAKANRRRLARSASLTTKVEPPASAAADASALDPVG